MGNFSSSSSFPPLQPVINCVTAEYMGTWFVIGVKPTIFEKTCSNAVERYSRVVAVAGNKNKPSYDVDIDFTYNQNEPIASSLKSLPQKGWIQGNDKEKSGVWKVSPFWPLKMPYTVIELDQDKGGTPYTVIGYPNREYVWIMARKPVMNEDTYNAITKRLVQDHQYSLEGLRRVPQVWTKEERDKRGLTSREIPDELLTNPGTMSSQQ